jgi:hypothetical protein
MQGCLQRMMTPAERGWTPVKRSRQMPWSYRSWVATSVWHSARKQRVGLFAVPSLSRVVDMMAVDGAMPTNGDSHDGSACNQK